MNFEGHPTAFLRQALAAWERELETNAQGKAAQAPQVIAGLTAEIQRRHDLDRGHQVLTQHLSRAAKRRYFDD